MIFEVPIIKAIKKLTLELILNFRNVQILLHFTLQPNMIAQRSDLEIVKLIKRWILSNKIR